MTQSIRYGFIGDDDLTPVLARQAHAAEVLASKMGAVGDKAAVTSRKIAMAEHAADELADELARAARQADDLADELDGVGRAGGQLAAQITATKTRIKELATEIDRTTDKSLADKLFGDLRKERSKLAALQQVFKELGDEGGKSASKGFIDALGALPSQLRGAAIVAAVGIGASLAPTIGAMISAAVVGAVGVGGLAGGIALAARHSEVQNAAKAFADQVSGAFAPIGAQFAAPTIKALDILGDAAELFAQRLDLSAVVEQLGPLATGFSNFAINVMPGINKALGAAGPIIHHLAQELPELGDAISDALGRMADNEGTVLGFIALLDFLEVNIRGAGEVLRILGEIFAWLVREGAKVTGFMEDMTRWSAFLSPALNLVADGWANQNDHLEEWLKKLEMSKNPMESAGDGLSEMARQADALARGLEEVDDAWRDWIGDLLGVDEARLGFEKALRSMGEAIQENGRSLDIHSKKGQAVIDALQGGVEAALRLRDAQVEAGVSTDAANREYDAGIKRLIELAVSLGITREKAEAFFGTYRNAPPLVVTFTTPGLDTAIAKAAHLARILDRVDAGASAHIMTKPGQLVGYQHGGTVAPELPPGTPVPILAHAGERVTPVNGSAPQAGVGAVVNIHLTVMYPDGQAITREQQRFALQSGTRSLEALFGLPAIA